MLPKGSFVFSMMGVNQIKNTVQCSYLLDELQAQMEQYYAYSNYARSFRLAFDTKNNF